MPRLGCVPSLDVAIGEKRDGKTRRSQPFLSVTFLTLSIQYFLEDCFQSVLDETFQISRA